MDFQELMARMAELDKPVNEEEKANKDYDGDGEIESPKDEVWGSRAKAAAKSGKPFKEESVEETFEQGIEEIASEVDECGDMMGSMPSKQQDNVSMNVSMNGSGSGGIRDLMNILRNLEQGSDDHSDHGGHDDGLDMKLGQPALIMKKDPVLGDEFDNSPAPVIKQQGAFPQDTGNDLHRPKGSYPATAGGDNPMALESIKNRLNSMYQNIKSK